MANPLGEIRGSHRDVRLECELEWLKTQEEDLAFFPQLIAQTDNPEKRIKRVNELKDASAEPLAKWHRLQAVPAPFLSLSLVEQIRSILGNPEKSVADQNQEVSDLLTPIAAQVKARIKEVEIALASLNGSMDIEIE